MKIPNAVTSLAALAQETRLEIFRLLDDHQSNLPPGLARKDQLPPGLERQLVRRGTLPPGLEKRIRPCPEESRAGATSTAGRLCACADCGTRRFGESQNRRDGGRVPPRDSVGVLQLVKGESAVTVQRDCSMPLASSGHAHTAEISFFYILSL